MQKGFVMIPRNFFESDYWRQSRTYNECEAILDIITQVRFEASETSSRIGGREVTWGQAQWPASVRFLAARWKWTDRKVRTFIMSLKRHGVITTDDSQGVNIITLEKYLIVKDDTANDTTNDTPNNMNINELVELVTQRLTQQTTQPDNSPDQKRHSSDTKHNNGNNNNYPLMSPKGENTSNEEYETEKNIKRKSFIKPTVQQIQDYISEKCYPLDAQQIYDHYEMVGWVYGKSHTPIKDWKAAVRTWAKTESKYKQQYERTSTARNTATTDHPSDAEVRTGSIRNIERLRAERTNGTETVWNGQ